MSVVPGIPATRKRSRTGLLAVASPLDSSINWRRGLDYTPEGCTAPTAVPLCDLAVLKPLPVVPAAVHFDPFILVATDGCNDFDISNDDLHARAVRALDMGTSAILARELLESTTTTNPDLQGTAVDVSGGTPVGWNAAATTLLYNMMNAGYVGDVIFHAPTWLLPSFNSTQVGDIDPATKVAYIGSNPVAFDAGYSGLIGPGGVAGGAAPNVAGWVYVTGPVEYATGELFDSASGIAQDQLTNDRYAQGERPGIHRFDPCHVFAALVEVCPA